MMDIKRGSRKKRSWFVTKGLVCPRRGLLCRYCEAGLRVIVGGNSSEADYNRVYRCPDCGWTVLVSEND